MISTANRRHMLTFHDCSNRWLSALAPWDSASFVGATACRRLHCCAYHSSSRASIGRFERLSPLRNMPSGQLKSFCSFLSFLHLSLNCNVLIDYQQLRSVSQWNNISLELITLQSSPHQWSKFHQSFTLYIYDKISPEISDVCGGGRRNSDEQAYQIKSNQNNWSDCARSTAWKDWGAWCFVYRHWNNCAVNWMWANPFSEHPRMRFPWIQSICIDAFVEYNCGAVRNSCNLKL